MTDPILSVRNLVTEFVTREGAVQAVNNVSFDVYPGEALGIVGESGSGKSVTMLSVLGLIPQPPGHIRSGQIQFDGKDMRSLPPAELRRMRGNDIAMVFQDPMTSLNPVITVGKQICEALLNKNAQMSKREAVERAVELLEIVGVPDPSVRVTQYPHQFSGGMRQRAMIAMAMSNNPRVLVADEPTTALDVTIQAQVIEVLRKAQRETNAATILISHDLGLIAEFADRVIVMYGGRIVESGDVESIFGDPRHPYTVGLMSSLPRVDTDLDALSSIPGQPPDMTRLPEGCAFRARCRLSADRERCAELPPLVTVGAGHRSACHFTDEVPDLRISVEAEIGAGFTRSHEQGGGGDQPTAVPGAATGRRIHSTGDAASDTLLEVENLKMHFPIKSAITRRQVGAVRAVDGVSFALRAGETLGLVGESGCGKSTTGKAIMRLLKPTAGRIAFKGTDLTNLRRGRLRGVRRDMQILFQDPFSSLDPRMTVHDIIAEPLQLHGLYRGRQGRARVAELMELVGLNPDYGTRYPHQFSGGQRQRVGIARAIALNPDMLILDEPVSSLDVSIQAQVINLLMDLQSQLGLAYLFIAHDLGVVRQISHRVAVMYLGKIVEIGEKHQVYGNPTHPYTQSLLSAVPNPDPQLRDVRERIILTGDVPNPANPPSGCNFRTRCFKAESLCAQDEPELVASAEGGTSTSCHFPEARKILV